VILLVVWFGFMCLSDGILVSFFGFSPLLLFFLFAHFFFFLLFFSGPVRPATPPPPSSNLRSGTLSDFYRKKGGLGLSSVAGCVGLRVGYEWLFRPPAPRHGVGGKTARLFFPTGL